MSWIETHVFAYRHDGRHWELTIKATDAADARARIGKLAYATYDGVKIREYADLLRAGWSTRSLDAQRCSRAYSHDSRIEFASLAITARISLSVCGARRSRMLGAYDLFLLVALDELFDR